MTDVPPRDLRTTEGRMLAVGDAVSCAECTLPSRARLMVISVAVAAAQGNETSLENLARWNSSSRRTARKYLAMVADACGEDPVAFIRGVVLRQRSVAEWYRALELHGGRHGA